MEPSIENADRPELPLEGLIRTVHDVRPPLEEAGFPAVWLILAGAVACLFAVLLFAFLRHRKVQRNDVEPTRYQVARGRLMTAYEDRLQSSPDQFASQLSSAVRNFLGSVFELPAPEWTTEELLSALEVHPRLDHSLSNLIERFLSQCDTAKFARHQLDESGMEQLYQLADQIIDQAQLTHIREEASANSEAGKEDA